MPRKLKGRRTGEFEFFAKIPESAMESEALKTLPHAAFGDSEDATMCRD